MARERAGWGVRCRNVGLGLVLRHGTVSCAPPGEPARAKHSLQPAAASGATLATVTVVDALPEGRTSGVLGIQPRAAGRRDELRQVTTLVVACGPATLTALMASTDLRAARCHPPRHPCQRRPVSAEVGERPKNEVRFGSSPTAARTPGPRLILDVAGERSWSAAPPRTYASALACAGLSCLRRRTTFLIGGEDASVPPGVPSRR